MGGEILKGTVNLALYNPATNGLKGVDIISENVADTQHLTGIYANPAKAFAVYRTTFDAAVTAINVTATINDRINEWKAIYGNRYDDLIVIVNPSGGNHDITIIITRNQVLA